MIDIMISIRGHRCGFGQEGTKKRARDITYMLMSQ